MVYSIKYQCAKVVHFTIYAVKSELENFKNKRVQQRINLKILSFPSTLKFDST